MTSSLSNQVLSTFIVVFTASGVACGGDHVPAATDGAVDGAVGDTDGGAAEGDGATGEGSGDAQTDSGARTGDGAAGSGGAGETSGTGGTSGADSDAGIWGRLPESGMLDIAGDPVQIPDGRGGTVDCYKIICNGKLLQCADCEDNDGDDLIDSFDPECLGPCDNTEGPVLAPGIGGETGAQCKPRDCFFDYGNGPGNDDCRWAYFCDPLAPKEGCPYQENKVYSTDCPDGQTQECLDFCVPITPNGCDCFGCCTFPELAGEGEGGEDAYVWIGHMEDPGCTLDSVTDPAACPSCTPEPSCWNPCGRCEICLGKPTIPNDCFTTPPNGGTFPDGEPIPDGGTLPDGGPIPLPGGGTPSQRCAPGIQPCGLPSDPPCPRGYYCITGCCVMVVE